jgi:hypothetical protein
VTTFRYLTAAEWGMTWARPPQAEAMPDPEVYVHHVGGQAWMRGDAAAIFRALNTYAQQGKGYSALDYDILVHYDEPNDLVTIGEGRGKYMSAATRDRNELGEAVCLCANTELRDPRAAEVEGVARAIAWGIQKGWIAKDAKILGHRDNPAHLNATACPGKYLYAQLPAIRRRVAELLTPEVPEVNWNPSNATVAAITMAPPTVDVLAGKANDWAVIAAIKALEEKCGLPVTGRWSQALGLAINDILR